jgi:hypothetical protein
MRKQLRYTCDKRVLPKDPSKYAMQTHFSGTYAAPKMMDTPFVPRKGTWGYGKHRQNVPCVATPERTFKPGTFALKGGTWVWQSATIPQLPFRLPIAHEDT